MGVQQLGPSRGLIGEYFLRLSQNPGAFWIALISMMFNSSQESENYKWLGQSPTMREWLGKRIAKGFFGNGIDIKNKEFEATLWVLLKDLERDGTGQTLIRIRELADRTVSHWAKLLSELLIAGESTVCYDGQFFFDTDHAEGNNSTSQSNDLSIDISALPAAVAGSTTNPSPQEMQLVIMACIQAILGFKDNENEPMNENAAQFLVMVPVPLWKAAKSALGDSSFGGGETNTLTAVQKDFKIDLVANPRLTWTEQLVVFRTDGQLKPLIRQNEKEVDVKMQAEGSQIEFDENMWKFGVDARRNVGFGMWQSACMATMT